MFEECMVQITVESEVEGCVGLGPLNVQLEFEGCSQLDLSQTGRITRKIDLDNPIFVVANLQSPLGVHVWFQLSTHFFVPRNRLFQMTQIGSKLFTLGSIQIG